MSKDKGKKKSKPTPEQDPATVTGDMQDRSDETIPGYDMSTDRTVPGGMTQVALLTEMITVHGWSNEKAAKYKPLHKWGALVEKCEKARCKAEGIDYADYLTAKEQVKTLRREGMKAIETSGKKAKVKKEKKVKPPKKQITEADLWDEDLDADDPDLDAVIEEESTEVKGAKAAAKAERLIAEVSRNEMEEGADLAADPEPTYTPVKEYQRKPAAAAMAKHPHIHLKGVCIQNTEGAPCDVQALTMETIEHANSMNLNEVAVSLPDDLDPEQMMEEMDNERAMAMAEYAEANPPIFIPITGVKDYVFDGHMGAGPSGAERWMNCTGSLDLSRQFLETLTRNQQLQFADAGKAAREGTVAHAAAETQVNLMLGNISPEEAENTLLSLTVEPEADEAYTEEMAEWITQYVDLVKQYVDAGHLVSVESRLEAGIPLPEPLPNGDEVYWVAGSADFIALPTDEDPTTLTVGDLKYGDGVWVEVDENPQVRIYALGALLKVMDEDGNLPDALTTIDYHIIQPRLGGIKSWTEPLDDLLSWRDDVLAPALSAALRGLDDGAELTPGEQQCQWCPVRGNCPALAELAVERAGDLFDVINEAELNGEAFPETGPLSDKRLGELLKMATDLVAIKDDLKAEAERRLHRGAQVPGFCLVNYTPPRKWHDDAPEKVKKLKGLDAEQKRAAFKPPTLLTPKQAAEALLLKGVDNAEDILKPLYDTPDKRPVVAKEGDRRSLWTGKPPEQMFPDLADDE